MDLLGDWIVTLICLITIPLVMALHKGEFQVGGFIAGLALVIIYNIWTGILPEYFVVFGVLLIAVIFFINPGGSANE